MRRLGAAEVVGIDQGVSDLIDHCDGPRRIAVLLGEVHQFGGIRRQVEELLMTSVPPN